MKKALKELIDNVPTIRKGDFSEFMFVSNGVYDGFWGKNGYNNIIVLGKLCFDNKWYKLANKADKIDFYTAITGIQIRNFNLDIPSEYGVPRIYFDVPIRIDYSIPTSSLTGHTVNWERSKDENGD